MGAENKTALTGIKVMRSFNKLFNVIAFFICMTGISFAESIGIVFEWEPFIVNDYLQLSNSLKRIPPKKIIIPKEILGKVNNIEELLHVDLETINNSPGVTTKKHAPIEIKVMFSFGNSFLLPYDEISSRGKDGKLSRATDILPSLVRDPSKDTAVETIKLIEPQFNMGFEF
jgi:hypothetical protein